MIMGVYIRGMEMPTEEEIGKCIIVRHDGEVWNVEFDNLVDGGFVACYPTNPMRAVPVPPHGALIDRDEMRETIKPWSPEDEMAGCTFDTVKKLMHTMISRAPVIIPAEKGK